jgi:hypothetical protein
MPRVAINYQSTVIYKIVCDDLTVKYCYVGSTTDFTKRKCQHKSNCNNEKSRQYKIKLYKTIRENGGWDNWSMVLIEKYSCENKQQAEQRERFWYEELNADLNTKRPHITEEELKESQKEYMKEYKKEYDKVNQEKIKEYRKNNQDKIKKYYKEYRENNQDKLKEYDKEYYQANKEKQNKQQRERRALKKQLSAQ